MDNHAPATPPPSADDPIQDRSTPVAPSAPTRPRGPNASPIVVGLVALLFAGLIIAKEAMNLRVNWSGVGPGSIVVIGVVMVAIGAIGLARRHNRT